MKLFYLVIAIIFSVILLIFGFGNVGSRCVPFNFFFTDISSIPVPITIFFIGIIGMLAGAFYVFFFYEHIKEKNEEEEDADL